MIMRKKRPPKSYLFCIKNDAYPASLEVRKVYERISDPAAEKHGLVRVVDESGEDYLYPERFFVTVQLPSSVRKAFARAS